MQMTKILIKYYKKYLAHLKKNPQKITLVQDIWNGDRIETKLTIPKKPSFEDFMNYIIKNAK